MLITYCNRTCETGQRLRDLMPEELKERKVVLNIGNSEFDEESHVNNDYQIINCVSGISHAVDKKWMFRIFKKNKIKSVDYIDLKKLSGKIKAFTLIMLGNELVFRGNGLRVSKRLREINKNDYATKKENKMLEYRAIVFKDKIIRMMVKLPYDKSFQLKQENCKFKDIDINKIPEKEKLNIINSVKCLWLDLAGVDVMINDKFEWKILEVNSGMSMSNKSCKLVYEELK